MVEALTGGLVGPHLSRDVADPFAAGDRGRPQRIAHLVLALDPSLGDPEDGGAAARDRLADLADQVAAAGGRVPGTGRSAPGELGDDDEIEVDAAVLDDLRTRAARRGPGGPPAPDGDDREQKGSA
ncbi:hypothetical protein LUX39_26065 [Actinomadura madurae]|nr:hypothetical protein [Actinomadura madurae]MCQ0016790.1 hypothetical protein [Actinomadura madurae]